MPLAREGYSFVAIATAVAIVAFVVAAVVGSWLLWLLAYLLVVLALFLAFFFRDPERWGERGPHLILAPADGRVMQVAEVQEPSYLHGPAQRVSIFLSIFNVHVQRAPVAGLVDHRTYQPGKFLAAWAERASLENEQASIGIDTGNFRVLVRQIAGLIAQRIVTYVEQGARVEQGDRIGLIRFGSRVDIFVPPATQLRVRLGDRVYGGQTVLGEFRPPQP